MKNQYLYDGCKSFVLSALKLLNKKIESGETIPIERKEHFFKDFRIEYSTLLAFWRFIYKHNEDIKKLPEFGSVELIKDDIEQLNLIEFLIYYVNKTKSLNFDENIFNSVYHEAESYFHSKELNFMANAPLQNFECEMDNINLENNLRIRKLTKEEFSELCVNAKNGIGASLPFRVAINIEYQIEMPYSIQKGEPISDQEPKEIFDKLISALRLFKAGSVGYTILKSKSLSWQPMMGTKIRSGIFYKTLIGDKYKLTSQECKKFEKFWSLYQKHDFNQNESIKFIVIAIKRFDYTYEREKAEDKLIDFIIALEALFLKEEEKSELTYKLAIRMATFLGDNKKEKQQIFSDVKNAYNVRSKIIHGSSKIKSEKLISQTSKIEECVRSSINKFLIMIVDKSHIEIIKNIDEKFF